MLPFGLDFECARRSASPRDDDDVFANSAAAATGSARSFQTFSFPSTDCFRLSVQNLVPVTAVNGRPKPRERDAEFSRKRLVPVGKAIARSISVGGATEKRVRKHCNIDEQRLDRGEDLLECSSPSNRTGSSWAHTLKPCLTERSPTYRASGFNWHYKRRHAAGRRRGNRLTSEVGKAWSARRRGVGPEDHFRLQCFLDFQTIAYARPRRTSFQSPPSTGGAKPREPRCRIVSQSDWCRSAKRSPGPSASVALQKSASGRPCTYRRAAPRSQPIVPGPMPPPVAA